MTTALTNLYVRNLPMEWTAADLIALGEKYGPVVSAKVLYNPLTTASRGMGFIRFAEHADATLAIAGMNGHIPDSAVHAKPLNVQFAKDQQSVQSNDTQPLTATATSTARHVTQTTKAVRPSRAAARGEDGQCAAAASGLSLVECQLIGRSLLGHSTQRTAPLSPADTSTAATASALQTSTKLHYTRHT